MRMSLAALGLSLALAAPAVTAPTNARAGDYWAWSADSHWPWGNLDAVPYWPDYREPHAVDADNCIRWNWQQHAYYNYCPDRGVFTKSTAGGALRVRD